MRTLIAVAVFLTTAAAVPGPAKQAPAAGAARCYHTSWFHHDPPLTMDPDSGKMRSAEPGELECYGVIDGVAVAGKGTYTWQGYFGKGLLSEHTGGGNCFYGSGYGTFKGEVPKVGGGMLKLRGEFNFVRALHAGREWGTLNGVGYEGFLRGDTPDIMGRSCSEVPITRSNIYSDMVVGATAGP